MKSLCLKCGDEFWPNAIRPNLCAWCNSPGFPNVKETMSLRTMKNVSKKQIAEIDRRRILPDNLPDGKYVSGSIGSNGKLSDRPVDLT